MASLAALASSSLLKSMVTDMEAEDALEAKRMADEEEGFGCRDHGRLESQGDFLKGARGVGHKKRRQSLYNFFYPQSLPLHFKE